MTASPRTNTLNGGGGRVSVSPPSQQCSGAMSPLLENTDGRVARVVSMDSPRVSRAATAHVADGTEQREPDDLPSLVAFLEAQRKELMQSQQQDDAKRAAAARREAAARAGKFVGGAPWRRPCTNPDEFSKAGTLPSKYLQPAAQAAAPRPARTYELPRQHPDFAVGSAVPRIFGDKEKPLVLAGVSKVAAAGSFGAGKSPRLSPRLANIAGLQATHAPPRWVMTNTTPRELDSARYLPERHPVTSAAGQAAAAAAATAAAAAPAAAAP